MLWLPVPCSGTFHSSVSPVCHKLIGIPHSPVTLTSCSVLRIYDVFNCFIIILEKSLEEEEVNECGQSAIVNRMAHHLLFKLLGCINLALGLFLLGRGNGPQSSPNPSYCIDMRHIWRYRPCVSISSCLQMCILGASQATYFNSKRLMNEENIETMASYKILLYFRIIGQNR